MESQADQARGNLMMEDLPVKDHQPRLVANPPPPYHQPIPDMIRWDIGQSQPITAVGVGFAKMDFQKYFAANVTFVYV
jgi:hypothetical protein